MGRQGLGFSVLLFAFWVGATIDPGPDMLHLILAAGLVLLTVSFAHQWREARLAARDQDSLELARKVRDKERVLANRERVLAARERGVADAEGKLLRAASTLAPKGRN